MATLFFVACAACLFIGPHVHPMARAAGEVQILLSSAAATAGVSLVWLAVTFLFGRVYCSSACPVGTLSDIFLRLRRRVSRLDKPFSYRQRSPYTLHILWIYLLCVVLGVVAVPFVIEPWNMMRNVSAIVNPENVVSTWGSIGRGAIFGAAVGCVSLIVIAVTSIWRGREFCSRWCPLGAAMGVAQRYAMMHIEIDPDKCVSCGRCEDNCRSQCIKMQTRLIDESRCVRCFDCVAECPTGAIRYKIGRNRPATPLFTKVKKSKAT